MTVFSYEYNSCVAVRERPRHALVYLEQPYHEIILLADLRGNTIRHNYRHSPSFGVPGKRLDSRRNTATWLEYQRRLALSTCCIQYVQHRQYMYCNSKKEGHGVQAAIILYRCRRQTAHHEHKTHKTRVVADGGSFRWLTVAAVGARCLREIRKG